MQKLCKTDAEGSKYKEAIDIDAVYTVKVLTYSVNNCIVKGNNNTKLKTSYWTDTPQNKCS